MALTPAGGLTPYATVADMTARYDLRTLGDWMSDTGTRLTPAQLTADPKWPKLLGEASGYFEISLMAGQRYQLADISAMLAQGGNGAQLVVGMICGWCMYLVWNRRPSKYAGEALPAAAEQSVRMLELLAEGRAVLPFQESAAAGLPEETIDTPCDYEGRQLTTVIARPFFGRGVPGRRQWGRQ